MTENARALAASLNREIVDDQPDRLSIHTHSIRLTQANVPYKLVPGKRLPSEKHFAVYADQIVLAETLQNPGRNIELHAREIIIEKPATLDVAGAYAEKDFRPGDPPIQKDARPGAEGTDGDTATVGGNAGSIVIDAHHLVNKTSGPRTQTVADLNAVGAQILAEHPLKIDDTASLPAMEITRTKVINFDIVVTLENGRVEGLSQRSAQRSVVSVRHAYQAGAGRLAGAVSQSDSQRRGGAEQRYEPGNGGRSARLQSQSTGVFLRNRLWEFEEHRRWQSRRFRKRGLHRSQSVHLVATRFPSRWQ